MTTLFDATLALARIITATVESVATGGSTTTLVDTTRTEPNDYFTGGAIWFLSGNNISKSAHITSYVQSTGTFTFATQAGACAAGDRYVAAPIDYPRAQLIQFVNLALQDLGDLPQTNTALLTVADQEKYDLPSGVRNVLLVEIATETTAPLLYVENDNWREYNDDLLFDTDFAPVDNDFTIRLWYEAAHAELTTDAGTVAPYVHIERLKWEAAVYALEWMLGRRGGDDPYVIQRLNKAALKAERMIRKHPVIIEVQRAPHLAKWGYFEQPPY